MPRIIYRKRMVISSAFCFLLISAIGAAAVYFEPDLLDKWIGPAITGGPVAAWLLFLLLLPGGTKDTAEDIPSSAPCGSGEPGAEENKTGESVSTEPEPPQSETQSGQTDSHEQIIRFLGYLQREGRLLDFLEEDIEPYDDAQVGAAAREVHKGCRTVLHDMVDIKPVLKAEEGAEVEVDTDYDPSRIKLIGNLQGRPPFKGILRHPGWRITGISFPEARGGEKPEIACPAEVEVV